MEVYTNEGNKRINDVHYIPKLNPNLLSVGQIMKKNYKLMFQDRKCMIFYKNKGHKHVTMISMTRNRLFSLRFGEKSSNFTIIFIHNKSWLWYLRYGHLNFASLKILDSNEMVYGLPKVQEHKEACANFAMEKYSRTRFPKG